jgi:hypothetical protein
MPCGWRDTAVRWGTGHASQRPGGRLGGRCQCPRLHPAGAPPVSAVRHSASDDGQNQASVGRGAARCGGAVPEPAVSLGGGGRGVRV